MSIPQPSRRPQGARHRTPDQERQPSLPVSGSEATYSYSEDGVVSSSNSLQGAQLARSAGRRRGIAPPRTATSNSTYSVASNAQSGSGSDILSAYHQILDSPEAERPRQDQNNRDNPPFFKESHDRSTSLYDPAFVTSPSPSATSFHFGTVDERRPSLPSEPGGSTPSRQHSNLPYGDNPSRRNASTPSLVSHPGSSDEMIVSQGYRSIAKKSSSHFDSDGSASQTPEQATPRRRWATIKHAISQVTPPVPAIPSNLASLPKQFAPKLTPASLSVAPSSIHGSATGISGSKAGSAVSALSEAIPSTVSSTSNSRPAKALMNFKHVVDQAKSGVTAGLGGMTIGGFSSIGAFNSGMTGRPNVIRMESNSQLSRDILQACWMARFGPGPSTQATRNPIGTPPAGTAGSSATVASKKPSRKATMEGSIGEVTTEQSSPQYPMLATPEEPQLSRGSLRQLHHLIVNNVSLSAIRGQQESMKEQYLPHQSLVLSVLLLPFVTSSVQSGKLSEEERRSREVEQWLAIETMELIAKSWKTFRHPTEEVERWLWCCHSASQDGIVATARGRILLLLERMLSDPRPTNQRSLDSESSQSLPQPQRSTSPLERPKVLQTLFQALYLAYPRLYGQGAESVTEILQALTNKLQDGSEIAAAIELSTKELEDEYGVRWSDTDDAKTIRAAIVTESCFRLLELGSENLRRWFLLNFIEPLSVQHHWAIPKRQRMTPLRAQVERRKIITFLRGIRSFIRTSAYSSGSAVAQRDAATIFLLLQTRALPEIELLSEDFAEEPKAMAIFTVLRLLNIDGEGYKSQFLLNSWFEDSSWKPLVEKEIKRAIMSEDWDIILPIIETLRRAWSDDIGDFLATLIISSLFERLTVESQSKWSPDVTNLLSSLSTAYPTKFYAPLFACARSSKNSSIAIQLRILTALSRAFPELWISNSEMMCIALMGDVGVVSGAGKGKQKAGEPAKWGKARLGQCVLFLELIAVLRNLNNRKKDEASAPPANLARAGDFFISLETKLAVLIDAKETSTLLPFSMRLLIASLFFEIRLFTRSLKRASWIRKFVTWGCASFPGALLYASEDPFGNDLSRATAVTDETLTEFDQTIDSIRVLYSTLWLDYMNGSGEPKSLTGRAGGRNSGQLIKSSELERSLSTLASLPSAPIAIFQLLVLVSGLLSSEDCEALGPVLWDHFVDGTDPLAMSPAGFLLMQCAERGQSPSVLRAIQEDLRGESDFLKRRAITRLASLFSWRYQILAQPVITDRAHRRPFRSGRPPLSFIPTDIGSLHYVPDRGQETERLHFASTLPPEVRRRLIELGWDKDTAAEEKANSKNTSPLSVSPADRLIEGGSQTATSGAETVTKGLLRRKSSTGAQGGKKRPIFVAQLADQFQLILELISTNDPEIASCARNFLLEVLRDDPGMFSRPMLERLSDPNQFGGAVASLERTFRLQPLLPSAFTHIVFNHLAGLLKALSRDPSALAAPMVYAYSLPPLSKSVPLVSGMSIRELRKAKLDPMLLPSGSLWFSDQMLAGPMFPRDLPKSLDPFEPLPSSLVAITMIRTAQNIMLTDLLKRDPKEVHSVRKAFTNFILPSLDRRQQAKQVSELGDFLPQADSTQVIAHAPDIQHLSLISLALARSHLLLVAQIFRCLSRQTNDYAEVARLLDGVNRILVRHGDDLGIVSHALIDYMIAATRFRRMFASTGGFMLIMPAIWKVYCEAEKGNLAIRGAVEYAANRFNALHGEVFIFQSVDVAASMIFHPKETTKTREAFAANVTSLFVSLSTSSKSEINAAGIQNVTKTYEQEAILNTLNDAPEVLLDSLQRGESMATMVNKLDSKPFPLDNFARLFLTMIADDPSIIRSQRFLSLFRYVIPTLYNHSMTARTVIRDGIGALGTAIFSKNVGPRVLQRKQEVASTRPPDPQQENSTAAAEENLFGRPNAPSDFVAMRQEYLFVIVAFTKAGGQLPPEVIRRALELLKITLRDSPSSPGQGVALFLQEFTESCLLRESRPTPKQAVAILQDIPPLIYSHGYAIDFSGVFNALNQICKDERFINDHGFVKLIVSGFCSAAFDTLETAASENMLRAVQFRKALINLLITIIPFPHVDVLKQLQTRFSSAGVLASLVLPICLRLPTAASVRQGADGLRRAWLQLMGYAVAACEGKGEEKAGRGDSKSSDAPERQIPSGQGIHASPRGIAARMLLALQIIKAIIIRAGDDIAVVLPDVWLRVASVIRDQFRDGNGLFTLKQPHDNSPLPSPTPSRPVSPIQQSDYFTAVSSITEPRQYPPRATDYGVWSVLEMLCFYRSPLNIQLRLWLQEKLSELDQQMETRQGGPMRPAFNRESRRQSFSPFTKSRRKSGMPSATPSPSGSPSFRPMRGPGLPPQLLLGSPNTISTFDRFPQASPPADPDAIRIRHLGPEFRIQEAKKTPGPANPTRAAAALISISRTTLIRESHRRVMAVRIFWGYETFTGDEMTAFEAWTVPVALGRIIAETQELTQEFHDITKMEIDN